MSETDLEPFYYAEAKAKGEKTRSLFGRGALDVMLHHEGSTIYSVANGRLSRCKIYWENDAMIETQDLGVATKGLLTKYKLPAAILQSGTVVQIP